jgi:hypothetical protein
MRPMRRVLALWALALPFAAAAQNLALRPPSIAEALDALRRLESTPRVARGDGLEQTFVVPERPGQNQVSWYDFHWRRYDVPAPGGGRGGIRLYYYDSAREQARRALPAIRSSYARLVDTFHFNPTRRIPFILYGTQREFQTTNVFAVTESVLGVTSPDDLRMTVPYFGDHARFVEVATHEMVHQFTIQKLLAETGADDVASPIHYLPLWFVEGIAEYYSKGGIDVETDMFLRDLVWNPKARDGYEVLPFAEDRVRGYIPTYKLGQARVAFMADTYGADRIQAFLESAYLLGDGRGGRDSGGSDTRGFAALVKRVLGEPLEQVDERWKAWLKRRYYAEYLRTPQDIAQMRVVRDLPAEPESFVVSPDGTLALVRGIDRERGRARIYLVDTQRPRNAIQLASDNAPGFESLHPVDYGILAIGNGILGFAAQDGPGDAFYVVRFKRAVRPDGKPGRLEVGDRRRIDLVPPDGGRFIQISYPTFSVDGSHVAFVGVARDGQQDVYVAPSAGGAARRLTDDPYSEKDLAWGADGIYCASDATDHGRLNLFRIDPATGARTRLTTAASNDRQPRPQADGSVLFSSDVSGKPDIYLLKDGRTQRLTDFTTGLSAPAQAAKARGVFASTFNGGSFKMIEVPRAALLDSPPQPIPPATGDPLPLPEASFPEAIPSYQALSLRNWGPEAGFIYGGGASGGFAGRAAVLFADYLRDHVVFVDLAVWGSWDFTQALVLYEDRSRRSGLSLGAFHFVQEQLDNLDTSLTYNQRDFGLVGAYRYPLDRFRRLEFDATVGAIQRYCLTDFFFYPTLYDPCGGLQGNPPAGEPQRPYGSSAAWHDRNGGLNPDLTASGRFGYDTIRYDILTGPLSGNSLLAELGGMYVPWRGAVSGFFRADASQFFQIVGRSNFMLRAAVGTSFSPAGESRAWERSFWISPADNLRGFYPGDLDYLRGRHYYVAQAELQIPLSPILHLFIFDFVEGVAALDFGGIFNRYDTRSYGTSPDPTTGICAVGHTTTRAPDECVDVGAWDSRTLTGVLGVNVLLGPILLRVHFGHPYDIKGLRTPAIQFHDHWVTNITLRYFFW